MEPLKRGTQTSSWKAMIIGIGSLLLSPLFLSLVDEFVKKLPAEAWYTPLAGGVVSAAYILGRQYITGKRVQASQPLQPQPLQPLQPQPLQPQPLQPLPLQPLPLQPLPLQPLPAQGLAPQQGLIQQGFIQQGFIQQPEDLPFTGDNDEQGIMAGLLADEQPVLDVDEAASPAAEARNDNP